MQNRIIQLLKEPLLQFVVIGACIYSAYGLLGTADEQDTDRTILVDKARIEGFIGQWSQRWNRPPTRAELDGIINSYVREDILARQAIEMGLGEDDPVTRRRLAQKLEFLTSDLALLKEPAPGELEAYFQDNIASYQAPDTITFSHVFLDPDKRDEATLADADKLLAELKAAGIPDADKIDAGDRFMQQSYFTMASEQGVSRQLGSGFAETVMTLEPGQWHGPVLSGYGVHLVYVYALAIPPPPVFEEVQDQVLANWQSQQQEKFNAAYLEGLMNRYQVEIADVPTDLILEVPVEPNS